MGELPESTRGRRGGRKRKYAEIRENDDKPLYRNGWWLFRLCQIIGDVGSKKLEEA